MTGNFPSDINKKIIRDFGQKKYELVARLLLAINEENSTFRVVRCLLYLAKGNVSTLKHYIEKAQHDWVDVVYCTEYTTSGRIMNFNCPFD